MGFSLFQLKRKTSECRDRRVC